jgi:hypothetical protein
MALTDASAQGRLATAVKQPRFIRSFGSIAKATPALMRPPFADAVTDGAADSKYHRNCDWIHDGRPPMIFISIKLEQGRRAAVVCRKEERSTAEACETRAAHR